MKNSERLVNFWLEPILQAGMEWLFPNFTTWTIGIDPAMLPDGEWTMFRLDFPSSINMRQDDRLEITWGLSVS